MFNFFKQKSTNNKQDHPELLNLMDRLILLKYKIIDETNLLSNDSIDINISIHINDGKDKAKKIMQCFGITDTETRTGPGYRCLIEENSSSYGEEPKIRVFY